MKKDIIERSEDFEKKMNKAGSTDDIISGLVKGLQRNEKIIRWLFVSLVLDIALSIGLAIVAIFSWQNANTIDHVSHNTCVRSNQNSIAINDFLDVLIKAYKDPRTKSQGVPQDEINRQITKYQSMKVKVLEC